MRLFSKISCYFKAVCLLIFLSFSFSAQAITAQIQIRFQGFDSYMQNVSWWQYGYQWLWFQGYIPNNVVLGGYQYGRPLPICQTFFNDGVHPGKVIGNNCYITYGGREYGQPYFRILAGNGFRWRSPTFFGGLPQRAVPGGYENGHPLYICQARYMYGVYPGKIVSGNCNIGFNGSEVVLQDYRVLTWRQGWLGGIGGFPVPPPNPPYPPYPPTPPYPPYPPAPPAPPVPPPIPPTPPAPPVPPPIPPTPPVPPPVPPPPPPVTPPVQPVNPPFRPVNPPIHSHPIRPPAPPNRVVPFSEPVRQQPRRTMPSAKPIEQKKSSIKREELQ